MTKSQSWSLNLFLMQTVLHDTPVTAPAIPFQRIHVTGRAAATAQDRANRAEVRRIQLKPGYSSIRAEVRRAGRPDDDGRRRSHPPDN